MARHRHRHRHFLQILLATALLAGCHRTETEARAEAARLRRQIEGLRALSREAERRALFPEDRLTVGISEGLVRDALRAQLPQEATPIEPFRITVTDGDVHFENGQSLVALEARLSAPSRTTRVANVVLSGGLAAIEVDARTGFLRGRVALDRIELASLVGDRMEPGLASDFVASLGGRGLGAVGEMLAPLEIPMKLQRVLESRGIDQGPVQVPPARLSLRFQVSRIVPLRHRLFVILEARTDP